MNKNIIIAAVIALAVVGGYFLFKGGYGQTPSTTQQPASQGGAAQATQSIVIANFAFSPANASVSVGEAVTWTNNDSVSHTVTADDGSFNSGPIAPGNTFSHTFTSVGTIAYHCGIHPSMHASITVTR